MAREVEVGHRAAPLDGQQQRARRPAGYRVGMVVVSPAGGKGDVKAGVCAWHCVGAKVDASVRSVGM